MLSGESMKAIYKSLIVVGSLALLPACNPQVVFTALLSSAKDIIPSKEESKPSGATSNVIPNPVTPPSVNPVIASMTRLSLGPQNSCIASGDGVFCWGAFANNRLDGPGVTAVATGDSPTGLFQGGSSLMRNVFVGSNFIISDRLVNGTTRSKISVGAPIAVNGTTVPLTDLTHASQVAYGFNTNGTLWGLCRIVAGSLSCLGLNSVGQMGNGTTQNQTGFSADITGFSSDVQQVAMGLQHVCAIKDFQLFCWGSNEFGQLGVGSADSSSPLLVNGLSNVTMVSAGDYHTCAIANGGELFCWGSNSNGQIGINSPYSREITPMRVNLLTDVDRVALTANSSCARSRGELLCWGDNGSGQLGLLSTSSTNRVPVAVPSTSGVEEFALGRTHGCHTIRDSGLLKVFCSGSGSDGRAGLLSGAPRSPRTEITINWADRRDGSTGTGGGL